MAFIENYGTDTGVSIADRWSNTFTITQGTDYDRLSGALKTATLDISSWIKYPIQLIMKCRMNNPSASLPIEVCRVADTEYDSFEISDTYVRYKQQPATAYAVDMTVPRIIELYFPDKTSPVDLYVDGVKAFTITSFSGASANEFYLKSPNNPTLSFDLFFFHLLRDPYRIISDSWLTMLRNRIPDVFGRVGSDWIKKRYPVDNWPTEIVKTQIDVKITHRARPKPNPIFPHFYVDSRVEINLYIQEDTEVAGYENVDALQYLATLVEHSLDFAFNDIDYLLEFRAQQPKFVDDVRNKAWQGQILVDATHYLEDL